VRRERLGVLAARDLAEPHVPGARATVVSEGVA
jgi:hypothetical protein